jgi:hypothetical protein
MYSLEVIRQENPVVPALGSHWYTSSHAIAPAAFQQVIETQIVGLTFDGRQAVAAQLFLGEEVWLLREPKNRFDRNAIRVMRRNGRQIGNLTRHLAQEQAPRLDAYGLPIPAIVTQVDGETSLRGVRIRFTPPKEER